MKKHVIISFAAILVIVGLMLFCWPASNKDSENIQERQSEAITKVDMATYPLDTLALETDVIDMQTDKPEPTLKPNVELLFEAEKAELEKLKKYNKDSDNGLTQTSGSGYVGNWSSEKSKLTFRVSVPVSGMYELIFYTATFDKESYNTIKVNERILFGVLCTKSLDFQPSTIKAQLNAGENIITVLKSWGGIYIDCMYAKLSEGISPDVYNVEKSLANENASENTRRLMSYLVDIYGKYTLSGLYNYDFGINTPEAFEIYRLTGRYPAVMGFDLMDYSPSRVEFGAETKQIDYALEWDDSGGIATFIWHWNAPKDLINTREQPWYRGFYTEATTFNLDRVLNGEDPEGYALLLRDIDAISEQIKILSDKDIPILWRPVHEASGGWFWWGAYGAGNYKKLWILMFERMTYMHELNNLIWVFNGGDQEWYPGDEYVDIIGEDIYTVPHDYESQYNLFEQALKSSQEKKMIALSENGVLPDPDLMYKDNACWLFFASWNGEVIIDTESKKISDKYTEFEHFVKVYNHSKIITLDELPQLDTYSID